jgi:hypothetical protein
MVSSARSVRLALAGLAATLAAACSDGGGERRTSERIAALARDRLPVDMDRVADFSWDRLFVFGPYASAEVVERELGFSWAGAGAVEAHDDASLLVFVSHGELARHLLHRRGQGDFSGCYRPGGYARTEARFVPEDDGGWIRYHPSP